MTHAHQELALDEVLNALLDLLDVWLEHALQLLHHLEHQLHSKQADASIAFLCTGLYCPPDHHAGRKFS